MAFHVEIRRSFHRAAAFNLDSDQLRRLLEAWSAGAEVELGDRRWEPAKSELTVLEGRELAPAELGFGQGWQSATRSGHDVTQQVLRGAIGASGGAVAVLAISDATARSVVMLLESLGLRPLPWSEVRAAMIVPAGEPPARAAIVVLPEDGQLGADAALEYGLAIGALGQRAIVVASSDAPVPAQLRDLRHVSLTDRPELVERLRLAGCEPQVASSNV